MKRLVSFFLTLTMLLSLAVIGVTVASAETPTDEQLAARDTIKAGQNFKVRLGRSLDAYYTSLAAAYADAADGDTLYLIADLTSATLPLNRAEVKTLTLDGQGHTLTSDAETSWVMNLKATEQLTVRNIGISTCRGFYTADDAAGGSANKLILEGCNITLNTLSEANIGKNPEKNPANLFFDQYSSKTELVIRDSKVESKSGVGLIFMRNGGTHTVDIVNSTLTMRGNALNMDSFYNGMVGGFGNTSITVSVDGTSTLTNANTALGSNSQAFFFGNGLTVYLASGAKLILDPIGTFKTISLSRTQTNAPKMATIYDSGAIVTLSENARKQGVSLVGVYAAAGNTMLGWTDGTSLTKKATVAADAEATGSLVLKTIQFKPGDLCNLNGAAIRKAEPYGIRFSASVSTDLWRALTDNQVSFTLGMLVAPTAFVGESGFDLKAMTEDQYRTYACTKFYEENVDGKNSYHLALVGYEESKEAFETALSVTAYLSYVADGTTYTIYASYDPANNSRSIYQVAKAAKEAGETSPVIDTIISTVETVG